MSLWEHCANETVAAYTFPYVQHVLSSSVSVSEICEYCLTHGVTMHHALLIIALALFYEIMVHVMAPLGTHKTQ